MERNTKIWLALLLFAIVGVGDLWNSLYMAESCGLEGGPCYVGVHWPLTSAGILLFIIGAALILSARDTRTHGR